MTAGDGQPLQLWEPAVPRQLGAPLPRYDAEALAVATVVLEGRTLAVTGGDGPTVALWTWPPANTSASPSSVTTAP